VRPTEPEGLTDDDLRRSMAEARKRQGPPTWSSPASPPLLHRPTPRPLSTPSQPKARGSVLEMLIKLKKLVANGVKLSHRDWGVALNLADEMWPWGRRKEVEQRGQRPGAYYKQIAVEKLAERTSDERKTVGKSLLRLDAGGIIERHERFYSMKDGRRRGSSEYVLDPSKPVAASPKEFEERLGRLEALAMIKKKGRAA
jgi:hypothetical protein